MIALVQLARRTMRGECSLFKMREERGGRHYAFTDPLMRPYVLLRMGRELGVL